jgi:ferritin
MKLSKTLNTLINEQISHEIRNSNTYLQIASFFANSNLNNLSAYFKKQADDERSHADRFISFLQDRLGGSVSMLAVPVPNVDTSSLQSIAKDYLTLEMSTTTLIMNLLEVAQEEKDYMTFTELQWFISEQFSEENEAQEFNSKAIMLGTDNPALVLWDASIEVG